MCADAASPATVPTPMTSNARIDRAGRVLATNTPIKGMEYAEAKEIVDSFRNDHKQALKSAAGGLRSCIQTLNYDATVTARTKRTTSIASKLQRQSTLRLSTMGDIGGCRAVLPTLDAIYEVAERLKQNAVRRNQNQQAPCIVDYVVEPRKTGYRALHIDTPYGGKKIEVQLRTPHQHMWAQWMEDAGLKSLEYGDSTTGEEGITFAIYRWMSDSAHAEDNGSSPAGSHRERLGQAADVLTQAEEIIRQGNPSFTIHLSPTEGVSIEIDQPEGNQ